MMPDDDAVANKPAKEIVEMTDREIAEETLYWLRYAGVTLAQIQQQGIGGMMKSMMGARSNGA